MAGVPADGEAAGRFLGAALGFSFGSGTAGVTSGFDFSLGEGFGFGVFPASEPLFLLEFLKADGLGAGFGSGASAESSDSRSTDSKGGMAQLALIAKLALNARSWKTFQWQHFENM